MVRDFHIKIDDIEKKYSVYISKTNKTSSTQRSVKTVKQSLLNLVSGEKTDIKKPTEKRWSKNKKLKYNKQSRKPKIEKDKVIPTIKSSIIPEGLSNDTKKFIEATTNEVLYFTPEGLIYTEDKFGKLKKVENYNSLFPNNQQKEVKSKARHTKNSWSENITNSLNNERSKPENMGDTLFPFSSNNYQEPFALASPSLQDIERSYQKEEWRMTPDWQQQMKFQIGSTPADSIFRRNLDKNWINPNLMP